MLINYLATSSNMNYSSPYLANKQLCWNYYLMVVNGEFL